MTDYSAWTFAGSDTYPGGWVLAMIDTRFPPTFEGGAGCDLTAVRRIGSGTTNVASVGTILTDNYFMDALWYGQPVYTVTGDDTLIASWESFRVDSEDTDENGLITFADGTLFLSCGIQFGTAAQTTSTTFLDATGQDVVFKRQVFWNINGEANEVWQVDDTPSDNAFVSQTTDFNDVGTLDVLPFLAVGGTQAIGDYWAIGYHGKFSEMTIDTGTAGDATGVVNWEYWDGSTWSDLAETDGTNGLTTTGAQAITWTEPTDWERISLNGGASLYYVRLDLTTVFPTTTPVVDQGFIVGEDDALEYADYYTISAVGGALAGDETSVTFGSLVGTGDDRQGVLGGTIRTANPASMTYSVDFFTDIADITAVNLYGVTWKGAKGGILLETPGLAISNNFITCGEIDPGAPGGVAAEMLNCFLIDPEGLPAAPENYGLLLNQTPSASVMTIDVSFMSFITSGNPATQTMIHFTEASDYSVEFTRMKFFGDYTSATIDHGENDGLNADITLNSVDGSTPIEAQFDSTNGGTVTVVANPVTTLVNVKDNDSLDLINARVLLEASDGTGDFTFDVTPTSITRSGTTATVTITSHKFATNDIIIVRGSDDQLYNGAYVATDATANTIEYTMSGTPAASPATGTLLVSGGIIDGLTDANGDISVSRTFLLATPVKGVVRKSTTTPRFKSFPLAGEISTTTGLTINVQLIIDE